MSLPAPVGLFMNAYGQPRGSAPSPWAFVVPFLAIQVGRPLWTIVRLIATIRVALVVGASRENGVLLRTQAQKGYGEGLPHRCARS